jgi:CubicO group peptidase (beta-lactamase class C family)/Na+-transporting methylmalonyl-CoA/oxaloacetate decarboxylase gamma subunit
MHPTHNTVGASRFSRKLVIAALLLLGSLLVACGAPAKALAASAAASPHVAATSAAGTIDPKDLASFMDQEINTELAQNHIPGATVAVVQNGQIILAKGYGYADLATHTPVQADSTLFRVGSVSKLFTWTAVMQLAEEGKVDLHADINQYLKTFKIPATYSQLITLANLMTHTAGFEEEYTGLFADRPSDLQPLGQWLSQNIPARVYAPGTVPAYSNYGAALAGYIVQEVSGEPFDQYIANHILQPLQMVHSSFAQPLPSNLAGQLATGYSQNAQGGDLQPQPFEAVQVWPAGSLSTTATDMANFMIAHLQDGQFGTTRILQAATAEEMHAQHFDADPRVPGMAYGFYQQVINGQALLAHGGDTQWFHSNLALLPAQNVGIFVSYNSPLGTKARDTLLQAFMDRYFPGPPSHLPAEPLPGYASRAQQIAGEYESTRRAYSSWEKLLNPLGAITVTAPGNGHIVVGLGGTSVEFVEIAPWVFQQVGGQDVGLLVFQTDSSGNVTHMLAGNYPFLEFTKDAWYQTMPFHLGLAGGSLVILLTALLIFAVAGIAAFIRRRSRSAAEAPDPRTRWARVLASLAAGLDLVVVVLALLSIFIAANGITPATVVPMVLLGVLAAFFSVWVVVNAVRAWRNRQWNLAWRIHYSFVALALVAFVFEMGYWNLLGFHVA